MKTKIFIAFSLLFINIDKAVANCEQLRQTAEKSCDQANIKDPLQLVADLQKMAETSGQTVPTILASQTKLGGAQGQIAAFQKQCYTDFQNCIRGCQAEANAAYAANDAAAGNEAQRSGEYCKKEPQQNYEAAKKGQMDIGQIMQGLGALLTALGAGGGDEPSDPCATNPDRCAVDTAAKSNGTSRSGTTRQSTGDGGVLEAALGNDEPATGEGAAPSLAQGTPGMGGGAGINSAGMGGAGPARGRGVAEQEYDGKPKINLASGGFGGGPKGGAPSLGASSLGKGSGNPIASRTGIDADGKSISSQAMENAMQARGLASGNGQMGGITAAHSLDNFQKVEKCIQNERNLLSER